MGRWHQGQHYWWVAVLQQTAQQLMTFNKRLTTTRSDRINGEIHTCIVTISVFVFVASIIVIRGDGCITRGLYHSLETQQQHVQYYVATDM